MNSFEQKTTTYSANKRFLSLNRDNYLKNNRNLPMKAISMSENLRAIDKTIYKNFNFLSRLLFC